jgi:hypothetical protein
VAVRTLERQHWSMDAELIRELRARARGGDVDAQTQLRDLLQDEPRVTLPPLSELLDPPDDSGDGGVREPRRPLPKGPSGSSAR